MTLITRNPTPFNLRLRAKQRNNIRKHRTPGAKKGNDNRRVLSSRFRCHPLSLWIGVDGMRTGVEGMDATGLESQDATGLESHGVEAAMDLNNQVVDEVGPQVEHQVMAVPRTRKPSERIINRKLAKKMEVLVHLHQTVWI
ncbi:hypothetical protein LXL04_003961 [Taraxacum kok-saghyz]